MYELPISPPKTGAEQPLFRQKQKNVHFFSQFIGDQVWWNTEKKTITKIVQSGHLVYTTTSLLDIAALTRPPSSVCPRCAKESFFLQAEGNTYHPL